MGRGYRADHTLVLIRHAKSDWTTHAADLDRPLNGRGQRQAPDSGRWIAAHLDPIGLAVVSPAQRARSTWDLVSQQLPGTPPTVIDERAYTFDGRALVPIVQELAEDVAIAALVGHNPAMEELLGYLTSSWLAMPTSCIAVIGVTGPWAQLGPGAELLAYGRPPD